MFSLQILFFGGVDSEGGINLADFYLPPVSPDMPAWKLGRGVIYEEAPRALYAMFSIRCHVSKVTQGQSACCHGINVH